MDQTEKENRFGYVVQLMNSRKRNLYAMKSCDMSVQEARRGYGCIIPNACSLVLNRGSLHEIRHTISYYGGLRFYERRNQGYNCIPEVLVNPLMMSVFSGLSMYPKVLEMLL